MRCRFSLPWVGVLLALAVGAAAPAAGQDPARPAATQELLLPEGGLTITAGAGDSLAVHATFDPNETVALVVRFASPPLRRVAAEATGAAKAGRLAAAEATMQRERQQFQAALSTLALAAKRGGPLRPLDARLGRDYRHVFNGLALTARRWAVSALAALPGVRVYLDVPVRSLDEDTNALIRADRVWDDLGATGAGVTIAVLDTGIDYTHPDLGGGFGAGFKVRGGFDFVDDDADPMDEEGHGTHVAGIAAADGPGLRGVAPGAQLLAVRVLDAAGQGFSSTVLAGLEYAVDPDGDPATDDAVDIINLSLGGRGSPSDPLSQAVDEAVRSGVLCAVAVGNQSGYRTIQSPGTAAEALSVGASTATDAVASFSARGPTNLAFTNKPDLLAPGSTVRSALLGGGYVTASGTSMAAPHAAGAAALLRSLHPTWPPEVVKAALVQSAADLGEDVWTQGGGRLDVLAAAQMPAVATPTTLSVGLLDDYQATRTFTETLTLHHLAGASQTFDLTVEGALPAGVSASVSPGRLTLGPGQRGTATVTLVFQTAQVPFAPVQPPPFVGRVVARSAQATLAVPFTFLHTPHLQLHFDAGPPLYLVIHGRPSPVMLLPLDLLLGMERAALPMPAGSYDLIGAFVPLDPDPRRFTLDLDVHEQVTVAQTARVDLNSRRGSSNQFNFHLLDADGLEMAPDYTLAQLIFGDDEMFFTVGGTFQFEDVGVATVGDRYRLNLVFHTLGHPAGTDYVIPFTQGPGIAGSTTLRNDPAAFKRAEVAVQTATTTEALSLAHLFYHRVAVDDPRRAYFFSPALRDRHRLLPPFRRTIYYRPVADARSGFRFQGYTLFDATAGDAGDTPGTPLFNSPILEITPDRVTGRLALGAEEAAFTTTAPAFTLTAGMPPPFWRERFRNTASAPGRPFGATIFLARTGLGPFFANAGGDVGVGPVALRATSGGTLLKDDAYANEVTSSDLRLRNLPPDAAYDLAFTFDGYQVQGVQGQATARVLLQLGSNPAADLNPPTFQRFELLADGRLTDLFLPATANTVRFTVRDVAADGELASVASASLTYRPMGAATDWVPLAAARAGDTFTASWPPSLRDGYYALRVVAQDAAGQRLDYVAEPAVRVGTRTAAENTPPTAFDLEAPADGAPILLRAGLDALVFRWTAATDADQDILGYSLRLQGPGLDTTLAAGPQTTRTFTDVARLQADATYTWSAQVSDGFAVVPAVRAFTFHTTAPTTTATEAAEAVPRTIGLDPAFPNPFRDAATLAFALPDARVVRLEVFDVRGRRVALLAEGRWPAGRHTLTWDATGLPAGLYLCRLTAGRTTLSQPLLRVR